MEKTRTVIVPNFKTSENQLSEASKPMLRVHFHENTKPLFESYNLEKKLCTKHRNICELVRQNNFVIRHFSVENRYET